MADVGKRGLLGLSNAKHIAWRGNGGGIYPMYMRETYKMAGLTKITQFVPDGQTKNPPRKNIKIKAGFRGGARE